MENRCYKDIYKYLHPTIHWADLLSWRKVLLHLFPLHALGRDGDVVAGGELLVGLTHLQGPGEHVLVHGGDGIVEHLL